MKCRLLIFLIVVPALTSAQSAKVDRAIKAVKELCLVGTQYDLRADTKGNLTLTQGLPNGQGSVSVNVRESTGAAAVFDDKVRLAADADIRECIKPHIGKIVDAILELAPPEQSIAQSRPKEESKIDSLAKKLGLGEFHQQVDSLNGQGITAELKMNNAGQQFVTYDLQSLSESWQVQQFLDSTRRLSTAWLLRNESAVWEQGDKGGRDDLDRIDASCRPVRFENIKTRIVQVVGQPTSIIPVRGIPQIDTFKDQFSTASYGTVASSTWETESGQIVASYKHWVDNRNTRKPPYSFHITVTCALTLCVYVGKEKNQCSNPIAKYL
jgi:hypothetical protein